MPYSSSDDFSKCSNEILLMIARQVQADTASLGNFCLTNRRFCEVGQEAMLNNCILTVAQVPLLVGKLSDNAYQARFIHRLCLCLPAEHQSLEYTMGPISNVFRAKIHARIDIFKTFGFDMKEWITVFANFPATELMVILLLLGTEIQEIAIDAVAFDQVPFFGNLLDASDSQSSISPGTHMLYRWLHRTADSVLRRIKVLDLSPRVLCRPLINYNWYISLQHLRMPCSSILLSDSDQLEYHFPSGIRTIQLHDCPPPHASLAYLAYIRLDKKTCPDLKNITFMFRKPLKDCLDFMGRWLIDPAAEMERLVDLIEHLERKCGITLEFYFPFEPFEIARFGGPGVPEFATWDFPEPVQDVWEKKWYDFSSSLRDYYCKKDFHRAASIWAEYGH